MVKLDAKYESILNALGDEEGRLVHAIKKNVPPGPSRPRTQYDW